MKIAFCFLTYHLLERIDIWHSFFKDISFDKYIIYIHPKYSTNMDKIEHEQTQSLLYNKLNYIILPLENRINTLHKSHISIVYATISLLKYAYHHDNSITHFIFLTQHCMPLYSFNTIYNNIINTKYSIIDMKFITQHRYINLMPLLKQYIPNNKFVKQQANMILIRDDVKYFIQHDYVPYFKYLICPDEHYFINIFLHIYKKKCIYKQINFCNYNLNETQALLFNNVTPNIINYARKHGFLFMRKVSKYSTVNVTHLLNI